MESTNAPALRLTSRTETHGAAIPRPPALPAGIAPIPYWHTALLVLVLGGFSVLNVKSAHGAHSGHAPCAHLPCHHGLRVAPHRIRLVGAAPRRLTLRELIGGRWKSVEDFLLDIALAAGVWLGALMVIAVAAVAMGMNHSGTSKAPASRLVSSRRRARLKSSVDLPQRHRGLLRRGALPWLSSEAVHAIAAQPLDCPRGGQHPLRPRPRIRRAAAHGADRSAGLAFGLMSLLRKSLRPAMMAHTLQDTISGLLLRALR